MPTLADIFAAGYEITGPDGTKYTLRKPDQYEQGLFQKYLEARAHDAIDRDTRPGVTDEARDRRHHLVDVKAGLGYYSYDGPYGIEAQWLPHGMAKLVTLVCKVPDETAEQIIRHHARTVAVQVLGAAAKADPKVAAQIRDLLAGLGFPTDWFASGPSEPSSSSSATPHSDDPPTCPSSCGSPTTSSSSATPSSAAPME
jgi:hypothetical protein